MSPRELLNKIRMYCKRHLFSISVIAGLLLVTLTSLGFIEPEDYASLSDSVSQEECAVYEAIIINKIDAVYKTELIVIRNSTYNDSHLLDWDGILVNSRAEFPGLNQRMISEFKLKNQGSYIIDCAFNLSVPHIFLSEKEDIEIFRTKVRTKEYRLFLFGDKWIGWDVFNERYPYSFGIMSFSRVAFDSRGDRAIVYAVNQTEDFSSRWLILMRKESGIWIIEDWMALQIP